MLRDLKLIMLENVAHRKALFATTYVLDEKRYFLVDCGADFSGLFQKPLKAELQRETLPILMYEGEVKTKKILFEGATFWLFPEKPKSIKQLEKAYGVKVYGTLGIDYLTASKIVLDFSKL